MKKDGTAKTAIHGRQDRDTGRRMEGPAGALDPMERLSRRRFLAQGGWDNHIR